MNALSRLLLSSLVLAGAVVPALVSAQTIGERRTVIASFAEGGSAANGASDNATFSQDNRTVRFMAFDTVATNLVPGDTNVKRDVLLYVRGTGAITLDGTIQRISLGPKGRQANGDSTKPSIDGEGSKAPGCITFESSATNIDAPITKKERRRRPDRSIDKSKDSDVYLRDIKRKTTSLVSVGQKNALNGVVDGSCEFVTYEAGGNIFVRDLEMQKTAKIARGTNPDQQTNGKGVAYERGGQIYYQTYQRVFNKGNPKVKTTAREVLVSANRANRPANRISEDPSMDDNGFYVAFESTATDLCTGVCTGAAGDDQNGPISDVFRRTLSKKAPTKDRMQMVSYSSGSTNDVNEQGNGPSRNPAMTGAGENVLFESEATNLRQSAAIREIDPNGPITDIYYWNYPRGRKLGAVSRESKPDSKGAYDGPSNNPATSNRANFVAFSSTQAGQSGEANGASIQDLFIRFLGEGPPDTDESETDE